MRKEGEEKKARDCTVRTWTAWSLCKPAVPSIGKKDKCITKSSWVHLCQLKIN